MSYTTQNSWIHELVTHLKLLDPPMHMDHNHPKLQDIHSWVSPTQNSRIFTHGSHPPKTPGYSPMGLTHPKLVNPFMGLTHPKLQDSPIGLTHPKLIDPPMGPTHAHYSTPTPFKKCFKNVQRQCKHGSLNVFCQ